MRPGRVWHWFLLGAFLAAAQRPNNTALIDCCSRRGRRRKTGEEEVLEGRKERRSQG